MVVAAVFLEVLRAHAVFRLKNSSGVTAVFACIMIACVFTIAMLQIIA